MLQVTIVLIFYSILRFLRSISTVARFAIFNSPYYFIHILCGLVFMKLIKVKIKRQKRSTLIFQKKEYKQRFWNQCYRTNKTSSWDIRIYV